MDTANSQKRSPRSSVKSKRSTTGSGEELPSYAESNPDEFQDRYDNSVDMVERVRRARSAAEKKRNAFSGNLDDYVLVRTLVGQKSIREQQRAADNQLGSSGCIDRQTSLNFVQAPSGGEEPPR